ncbi:hypothetical protein DVH05_027596 [Phytophthora capsici]|nr:hypothetical protein DVH05_027596 [Phytophthora capsici]
MSTDMVTLYERILALVPVDELQDGYNAVLSEEIASTNRAVNDVVAAFAKLQEVREAVRQVQQESTGTRSASLTKVMDATMALEEKLQKAMELTSAQMTKLRGKRKAIGDCVGERGRKVLIHQAKSEVTVQAASLKQDIQKVEPVMKVPWASELTVENCLERLRMMTQLPVDERSKHLPGVLSKLQNFISVNDETKQLAILKIVVLWAVLSAEHHDSLSAYDCFCTYTAAMIDGMSNKSRECRVKAELKRLNNALHAVLSKSGSSDGSVDTNEFVFRSYELLVWRVDTMDPSERTKHIPEILRLLKSEMLHCNLPDSNSWAKVKVVGGLIKALRTVRLWVEAMPDEAGNFRLLGELVEHIRAFVDKIWGFHMKARMYSEMQNFMRIGRIVPPESSQAQVERLLKTVKQLDDQSATSAIDTCICLFGEVAFRPESNWNPQQDPTVKECYDMLMKMITSREFAKRMKREGLTKLGQKKRRKFMEKFMGTK